MESDGSDKAVPGPDGGADDRGLSPGEQERLIDLLCQLSDDRLPEREASELRTWLERSRAARAEYLRFYSLHAALGAAGGLSDERGLGLSDSIEGRNAWFAGVYSLPGAAGLAAGLMAAAVLLAFALTPAASTPTGRARSNFVAAVSASASSEWRVERAGAEEPVGDGLLTAGDALSLVSGRLDLRFMNGVEAVLEPGSSLLLASGDRCVLTSGAIRATVPEGAEGFVVDTPYGRVLDLGTEFGVRVGDDVGVRVYRGEVELTPGRRLATAPIEVEPFAPIQLREGNGGRLVVEGGSGRLSFVASSDLRDFPAPAADGFSRSGPGFLAIEPFSQGRTGARALDRNGGLGWSGPWVDDRVESSSVSFLVSGGSLLSRGWGDGAIQRRLSGEAASLRRLYFSASFRMDGDDPECSAWLELYQHDEQRWSNGETDVAAIGITDGRLGGRLAPWGAPELERSLYDTSAARSGATHLVVGCLEFASTRESSDTLKVWVDPDIDSESSPDLIIEKESLYDHVDSVAVRCWELDGAQAVVDDVRVSDEWRLVVE